MFKILALAVSAIAFATPSKADTFSDKMLKEMVAEMQPAIGQTYWTAKRNNKGVEFCSRQKKKRECTFIFDTNLVVTGITGTQSFSACCAFVVRLNDGRTGEISYYSRDRLFSPTLTPEEQKTNRACEERGAPMIGMTRTEVLVCMGFPSKSNITETAGAKMEQMVYSGRAYVYIENNRVTAVQTSR